MQSFLRSALVITSLACLGSSCVLAVGTGRKELRNPEGASANGAASADAPNGKSAEDAEKKAKEAARKAEKKEREIAYARMELALAEMDAETDLRDAENDFAHAQRDLEAAQLELEHFKKASRPLELEDEQIDLDRSNEAAIERKAELDELISMYKKEEVAKLTKELVIHRGQKALEFAQRSLELLKKRQADKQEYELAVKERDLGKALTKAQQGLAASESKLKKLKAKTELELLRARHKLADAERPDDDEAAKPKEEPSAPAGEEKGAPAGEAPAKDAPEKPASSGGK